MERRGREVEVLAATILTNRYIGDESGDTYRMGCVEY